MTRHATRVAQIVIGVLVLTGLLLAGLGALLPRHWRVEERIMINAAPDAVHAWVNDLRHFPEWAQWNQADLAPQNRVSSPSTGAGATLTWHGRSDRGAATSGEVRIVQSDPEHGVWFENRTRGGEPSHAQLTYVPRPGVTEVIWRDEGELPPIVGGLFRDLFQRRLAKHMRSGLERLKDLVELHAPDPRVFPEGAFEAPLPAEQSPLPDASR